MRALLLADYLGLTDPDFAWVPLAQLYRLAYIGGLI